MRRYQSRLIAIVLLLLVGGIVVVESTMAIPPQPQKLHELAPGPRCQDCPPVVHEVCQLTGCLPTVDGGSALCQYNCFKTDFARTWGQ